MGIFLTKLYGLFENFSSTPSARVLMLGLDAAGKTTILYKIKLNETVSTIPTIGFNVETVTPVKGVSFTVWDVGGQEKIRRLWQHYFQNAQGLVFVVDSSDKERLIEAKEELFRIMNSDELRQVPVEIIANKQDLPGSLKPFEVAEKLELAKLSGHQWHIQGACAAKGDGLFEAMESLSSMIKTFQKQRYV